MFRTLVGSISKELKFRKKLDSMPLIDVNRDRDSNLNHQNGASASVNSSSIRFNRNDRGQYLRAKLRFFFMSPCWKWHLKRRVPWKAWFQVVKIIVLTIQLILFGIERETHVLFTSETSITFRHLFVKDWDATWETLPYPRASGDFALYTYDDMTDSINYVVERFYALKNISFGLYDFDSSFTSSSIRWKQNITSHHIRFCMNRFKQCSIEPSQRKYVLDIEIEDVCFLINASDSFDINEYLLNSQNETINYCSLNQITMEFFLHAVEVKNQYPFSLPDCYDFLVEIIFDNNARTGKIRQHLDSQAEFRLCEGDILNPKTGWAFIGRDLLIGFDCLIIVITFTSLILCLRSLWHEHRLCREVRNFYRTERTNEAPLTWHDLHVFYSLWYMLMIVTDLMVIPGSALKIAILLKDLDKYETAGILLGLSSFLSWICILRYLSFFRKYNILFLTLKKSLPMVFRFLSCALIIYCAYMFCGWIILGPYHTKFRSLSTTSEALFSLINGDDMYATFANIETESTYVWLFSEIYYYTFISLFIYVVVNLLITLLGDGYETVKCYFKEGFPKSRLQKFSEEDLDRLQELGPSSIQEDPNLGCFPCFCGVRKQMNQLAQRDPYLMFHIDSFS